MGAQVSKGLMLIPMKAVTNSGLMPGSVQEGAPFPEGPEKDSLVA